MRRIGSFIRGGTRDAATPLRGPALSRLAKSVQAGTEAFRGRRPGFRRGFSMIEAVIAVLIVGLLYVAVLNTLGASRTGQIRISRRTRAHMLADDLMNEILGKHYEEPGGTLNLGLDLDETLLSGRGDLDDADDYDGFDDSPPTSPDGATMEGFDRWRRTASVAWVTPDDPNTTSSTETGVKRITVRVSYRDKPLVTHTALRSRAGRGPNER